MITCCRFSIDSDHSLLCLCWKFWQLIITCYRFYIGIYFYILSWSYFVLFHSYWYIFHVDIFWDRTEETHGFRWKRLLYLQTYSFIFLYQSMLLFSLNFIDWSITYIWYFTFSFSFIFQFMLIFLLSLWSLVLFVYIWLASSPYL